MNLKDALVNPSLANHRGGIGELGTQVGNQLVNHSVVQDGTIGETMIVNHILTDAAPTKEQFVQKISEAELAKILGLQPYAGRALSVTCEKDIIQLPEELKSGWQQICEHFDRTGLTHANEVIWNNDFEVALHRSHESMTLDTFYFGQDAHNVRPNAPRLFVTEQMNDKSHFLRLAETVGAQIPHSLFFETKEQLTDISKLAYPCVFKINKSVAGLGTKVCWNEMELAWCLLNLRSGVGFHIQHFLGRDAQFISAQYVLSNGFARYITPSCNFIGGDTNTEHEGNWGGSVFKQHFKSDPNTIGLPIAQAIAQMGGEGWLGIDIGIVPDGRMYPVEANLRYTAAAYYYMTACKLGMDDQFWAGRSYSSNRPMSDFDLGSIEYTKKRGCGWILTNWGSMVVGKEQEGGSKKYGAGFLYLCSAEKADGYKRDHIELQELLAA